MMHRFKKICIPDADDMKNTCHLLGAFSTETMNRTYIQQLYKLCLFLPVSRLIDMIIERSSLHVLVLTSFQQTILIHKCT